jgi:hypothetical protein
MGQISQRDAERYELSISAVGMGETAVVQSVDSAWKPVFSACMRDGQNVSMHQRAIAARNIGAVNAIIPAARSKDQVLVNQIDHHGLYLIVFQASRLEKLLYRRRFAAQRCDGVRTVRSRGCRLSWPN